VVVLAVILCIIIGGVRPLLYFLFPLAVLAVQYPILYLILAALSFVISIIGVLKSDENNNTNLFYGSALLFLALDNRGIALFCIANYILVTHDGLISSY
jgi:hypothetical protein